MERSGKIKKRRRCESASFLFGFPTVNSPIPCRKFTGFWLSRKLLTKKARNLQENGGRIKNYCMTTDRRALK